MGVRLTLQQKGFILIALPLLLQVCFIAVLFYLEGQAEKDYWWELHSKTVLSRVNKVDALVIHLESAARGYAISGDPTYKQLYQQASNELPDSLSDLSIQVQDNPVQTASVSKIKQLAQKKIQFNIDLINAVDNGHPDEAVQLIKTKRGINLTADIEAQLAQFTKEENHLFETRQDARKNMWQTINLTLLIALALNFVIAVCLVQFFYREITRRVKMLIDNMYRFAAGKALNPVMTDNAELQLLDGAFRDTVRKVESLNQELVESRDQALQASRFKSEFLANVSHEIRTPMNGIVGMTDLLSRTSLSEQQQYFTKVIKDSTQALLTIINDVLDFSKVEVGKLTLEVVDFELAPVVEDSADLFVDRARQKGISLMTLVDPSLPRFAKGDPGRLRQILLNLIGNAVKFTEKGHVVVRAILETSPESTFTVLFEVLDTGIGLTEENRALLFRPFVQADGSTTRRFGGTGLGLSICKSLVELMNGEVGVRSASGEGSTFWFTVPLQQSSEAFSTGEQKPFQSLRVLIVDDEKMATEILSTYLQSWGMECDTANGGIEGVRKMLQATEAGTPYDLAIVDFVMPEMDGFAMGRMVQQLSNLAATKLILVTAFDEPDQAAKAIRQGFSAYLTKPVKQSQLYDAIANITNRKGHTAQAVALPDRESLNELFKTHAVDKKKLVLIVEDNFVNQQVALLELEELGIKSHAVGNGKEALEAMQHINYDLILMDCQMPELDGFQATIKIRQAEVQSGKHVPIIAMTAQAMQGDRQRCLEAGMDDYISKPIYAEKLIPILAKWIPAPEADHVDNVVEGAEKIMTTKEDQETSVFDIALLEKRFGADKSKKLFELFVSTSDELMEKLHEAVRQKNSQMLRAQAHQLKGSSLTIGARQMAKLCADIEELSKGIGSDANWPQAELLTVSLEKSYESVKQVGAGIV
jgi:polar amino acid transport system substrate-binding protein